MDHSVIRFWGKAGKPEEHKEPPFHPAICHMLDVAAVALVMLRTSGALLFSILTRPFASQDVRIAEWLAFLVALHDLGKISPGFQAKRRDIADELLDDTLVYQTDIDTTDHGQITASTLSEILREKAGCRRYVAEAIGRAVGGHHGRFHSDLKKSQAGGESWHQARLSAVETLREIFDLDWKDFPFDERASSAPFLLALAGLTSVADWIGSDEKNFLYVGDQVADLKQYFFERQAIAKRSLARLHLDAVPFERGESRFEELFPFSPNGCQRLALKMARAITGPLLVIVETPMGSGKTEAAVGIADMLIRERGASGFYYALPTQATGNQMFRRILEFLRNHPARNSDEIELHLLHGRSMLNRQYTEISPSALYAADGSHEAAVIASSWFANRKRGLISPCAVGTIDQALMATVLVLHMFVRMFGLAGKVVVIDEVHAYDAYTSEILYRLLEWLGALGTPVVLLSATLPADRRLKLVRAYAPAVKSLPPIEYPSVIAVDRENGVVDSEKVDDVDPRSFRIELHTASGKHRYDAIRRVLEDNLGGGGSAACLVNTVDDAQRLYSWLQSKLSFTDGTRLILFHARFPMDERLEIETLIEQMFGKGEGDSPNPARPRPPDRVIVIATQVLEQSLDVDFDLMVTDAAPIDLILQRAGRLQRHRKNDAIRPDGLREAVLHCLLPDLSKSVPFFQPSCWVYEPAILLLTALTLRSMPSLEVHLPKSVEGLISTVYGPHTTSCPEHLAEVLDQWEVDAGFKERLKASLSRGIILPTPNPLGDDAELLGNLDRAMEDNEELPKTTRLGEPSITIVVLHSANSKVYLDRGHTHPVDLNKQPGSEEVRALIGRSVSISNKQWYGLLASEDVPGGWKKSPLLKNCRAAVFIDGVFTLKGQQLKADPELGIVISRPESEEEEE